MGWTGLSTEAEGHLRPPPPRATDGSNEDGAAHHWDARVALWRSHCQAGIGVMPPICYYQNLRVSVSRGQAPRVSSIAHGTKRAELHHARLPRATCGVVQPVHAACAVRAIAGIFISRRHSGFWVRPKQTKRSAAASRYSLPGGVWRTLLPKTKDCGRGSATAPVPSCEERDCKGLILQGMALQLQGIALPPF